MLFLYPLTYSVRKEIPWRPVNVAGNITIKIKRIINRTSCKKNRNNVEKGCEKKRKSYPIKY